LSEEGEAAMVKAVRTDTRLKAQRAKRRARPEVANEEERILRAATLYLIRKHGMFLVATRARKICIRDISVWVVSVTLRYDRGDEGYMCEHDFSWWNRRSDWRQGG
jgi:hypothetical protein